MRSGRVWAGLLGVEKTVVDVLAELKPGRELYANVEFYAGVVMDRCGLPRELFTPTFAISRGSIVSCRITGSTPCFILRPKWRSPPRWPTRAPILP